MITPRTRSTNGFTLLELLVTAVVMGSSLVAASWAMNATARTEALYDANQSPALVLAREIHELAQCLPHEPAGLTGATSAAQVAALDALIGAQFSPPILADGSEASGLDGWSQHVALGVYAVGDLETPTADDPADGLPADGEKLYRLSVEIRDGGLTVDSFHWWLNP